MMIAEIQAPIRVFLVEDHALMRDGVRLALAACADIQFVGETDCGLAAAQEVHDTKADVVLLDYRLPDVDGFEVLHELAQEQDGPKVVFLSCFDEPWRVRRALCEGASGYLSKRGISSQRLAEAIRDAFEGNTTLSPDVTSALANELSHRSAAPHETLTPRELEVWQQLAAGATNAEIARSLYISERTVKFHVANILSKTGTRNRAGAAALAHQSGLLEPGA